MDKKIVKMDMISLNPLKELEYFFDSEIIIEKNKIIITFLNKEHLNKIVNKILN